LDPYISKTFIELKATAKGLIDFLIFHMIPIILPIQIPGLSELFIRCLVKSFEKLHSILANLNTFHKAF
jgi:hypothetical protein